MREFFQFVVKFFQGWRRPTGWAMLGLAFLILIVWGLSFLTGNQIVHRDEKDRTLTLLTSSKGSLIYETAQNLPPDVLRDPDTVADRNQNGSHEPMMNDTDVKVWWRRRWGEFDIGSGTCKYPGYTAHLVVLGLPYWLIVIPPTLLSAWLLLSKRQVAKPPELS